MSNLQFFLFFVVLLSSLNNNLSLFFQSETLFSKSLFHVMHAFSCLFSLTHSSIHSITSHSCLIYCQTLHSHLALNFIHSLYSFSLSVHSVSHHLAFDALVIFPYFILFVPLGQSCSLIKLLLKF